MAKMAEKRDPNKPWHHSLKSIPRNEANFAAWRIIFLLAILDGQIDDDADLSPYDRKVCKSLEADGLAYGPQNTLKGWRYGGWQALEAIHLFFADPENMEDKKRKAGKKK